jgi:hypothetical protein
MRIQLRYNASRLRDVHRRRGANRPHRRDERARPAGLPRGSVSPTLARLERVGLVRHKGDYWAAADDDRLAAASAAVLGLGSVAERHRDDWYGQHEGWADELEDLGEDGE